MKKVENTKVETEKNPMGFLAEAMFGGSGNAIERQEARGQQSFVGSDTLPTMCSPQDKEKLNALGVEFLAEVEGDPIFQYVKLPAGWKKVPTDHSMWSQLVDGDGKVRASIFYKAAFYDRSAHMNAEE